MKLKVLLGIGIALICVGLVAMLSGGETGCQQPPKVPEVEITCGRDVIEAEFSYLETTRGQMPCIGGKVKSALLDVIVYWYDTSGNYIGSDCGIPREAKDVYGEYLGYAYFSVLGFNVIGREIGSCTVRTGLCG